jgi:hypothetical protein
MAGSKFISGCKARLFCIAEGWLRKKAYIIGAKSSKHETSHFLALPVGKPRLFICAKASVRCCI